MENESQIFDDVGLIHGEDLGQDMREPIAADTIRKIRLWENLGAAMSLGDHGTVPLKDIADVQGSSREGHLTTYINKGKDPKVAVPIVIAIGVVVGGIAAIKHHRK